MKNIIKKINIFAFVLVFSFSGLFANPTSAQSNGNATFWNGSELVPIDWGNSGSSNNNGNNNNNNDGNDQVSTNSATNIDEDSATLRGEVTNGDNVYVWFVIDDNDSTPSCSDGSIDYGVSGNYDDGDDFSRTVSGLRSDRYYYFRACTDDDSGSIRSFQTDDDNSSNNNNNNNNSNNNNNNSNNNSSNSGVGIVALTTNATAVTTNSAVLNGLSVINEGGSGNAWFEYGSTTALGLRTPNQSIGTGSSNISRQILSLSQRTPYYFRLVIQNSEGTDFGDIVSLVTEGVVSTGSGSGSTGSTSGNTTTTSGSSTTSTPSVKLPDGITVEINSNLDKASVGDTVTYTVSYDNKTGKDLKNVIFKVELSKEIEFRKTTLGSYSNSDHSVLVTVETLPKGAKGEFTILADVLKTAKGESILVTSLLGINDNPNISGAQVSSTSYSIIEVVGGGSVNSDQSANSIFAGKFFPTSIIGWLLIILIIFLIILIARKISKDKEEEEEEKEEIKIAK